jgi:oligoendopeptidase F
MTDSAQLNKDLGTEKTFWNLDDLYSSTDCQQFVDDMAWCEEQAVEIASRYHQTIAAISSADLLVLITRLENLECRLGKLLTYTFLNSTTQIDNEAAGASYQQVHELANRCGKETIFFELEWNKLTDKKAEELLLNKNLAPYNHYLTSLRRYHPHLLPEGEEKLLIEIKSVGRKSWTTLFDKVIGNLRFGENGRTEEEVLSDLYNRDRDTRKQAATDLTAGLESQGHVLTHIYNTLAAEKMVADRVRTYPSWVSTMNLDNQVNDSTVTTLINAVTSRYDIVKRYYHLKASLLNLDTLYDYDRYAPLPALPTTGISWEHCQEIILDSFGAFSTELKEIAERFFENSWIHAPVQHGKRGGAFAHPCVPEVHPYLMVNYTGTMRDVSTVAHELGHGVHQVLASARGYFNSETPLVLAETASVFAEFLVFRAQVALLDNREEKRAFICQKLESIFATVFRQVAMNRFEDLMHEGRRKQGELSRDDLSRSWMQTQQEMFGDSVELREDYRIWWSYIPHFLNVPGYVYSYAFGELLVLALYGIYQRDGSSFVGKYFALLAAGGSASPDDLLKPFGIDLNDPSFWHQGLNVIDDMLKEVEHG